MANTKVLPESQFIIHDPQNLNIPFSRQTSIIGPEEKRSTENTANIVIIDHSGSTDDPIGMGDNRKKIDGIKEGTSMFITLLPPSCYVSIITFSSYVKVLWPMQMLKDNKLEIIRAIQSIQTNGSTEMSKALKAALAQINNVPTSYLKRCYLLTDGLPNSDPTSNAENLKNKGVQLHTIGFGDGCKIDEELLREMASPSPSSGISLYHHFTVAKNLTGFMKRQSRTI